LLEEHPACETVLALTPDAAAALDGSSLDVISTLDVCGDRGQARIVARLRRVERPLDAALASSAVLGTAARETFRGLFHAYAGLAFRAWESLRGGAFLIPGDAGWERAEDRGAACRLLLSRLLQDFRGHRRLPFRVFYKRPHGAPLLRLLNRLGARLLRARRPVLVSEHEGGFVPLERLLQETHPGLPCVKILGARGRSREWAAPLATLLNCLRGRAKGWLTAVPAGSDEAAQECRRILASLKDPVIAAIPLEMRELLVDNVALTQALADDAGALVEGMRPRAHISFSLRWLSDAAIAEACRCCGVPNHLVSHGSHPPPQDPVAAYELRRHARGMLTSPLAAKAWMQSPWAEAAAKRFDPSSARARCRPIMWGYRQGPPPAGDSRIILHAGTYKAWGGFRPWMYETSDEFVKGLQELVAAAAGIEDVRLVIRIRPAPELSIETLESLLPRSPNCEIRTDGSFLDDLARASVLVSYSSTTIEEALHARKPVLLWGGSPRYGHLPARTEPPTPRDRSAVYRTLGADRLEPMLRAILDAHAEKHLSPEELQDCAWPEEVQGLDGFLKDIVGRR